MNVFGRYWSISLAVLFCSSLPAQTKDAEFTQDSCRSFTQDFYVWYTPNTRGSAIKRNHLPPLEFALREKRTAFDPELVRQLDKGAAQAKRDGEPFLDFDPILNSQDPALRYEVDKVALKDGYCWANVYGVFSGKRGEKPDVIANLIFRNGEWLFTDFYYPDSTGPDNKSLVHMLRFLLKPKPDR